MSHPTFITPDAKVRAILELLSMLTAELWLGDLSAAKRTLTLIQSAMEEE